MLSVFARAYQSELLNTSQQLSIAPGQPAGIAENSAFSASLQNRLGDVLIRLGGRLKQQDPCPELDYGQA